MTQEELQKALEAIGKGGITVNGDLVLSKQVENEIGNVEAGGIGIQNVYSSTPAKAAIKREQSDASIDSAEREQARLKAKAAKPKKKADVKPGCDKPKTLKYYVHGNNGRLMKQRKRVDIVYKKWCEWGWIDRQTSPDDFDAFFEGEPRHCNITWTGNTTILTILLQGLLQQPYIEKQTGCAAKSLVEQQFGKTANSDRNRLDEDAANKIRATLYVLDIENPLPERRGRNSDEETDISDAALMEVYAGKLRSTKGI